MARSDVAFCAPTLVGEMSPVATTLTPGFGLGEGDGLGDGDDEGLGDGLGLGDGDGQGLWGCGLHVGEGVMATDTGTEPESLTVINTSNTSTTAEASRVATRNVLAGFKA